MPKPLPYFRWYPADAETDGFYRSLTDQELGFYHRCLNHSWMNDGLPANMDDLARALRVSRKYLDRIWKKVGQKFYSNEAAVPRLFNPRLEEEREYAINKSNKASASSAHGQSDAAGFIYLICRSSDGAIKIGSAVNVPRRLAQLKYKYRDDGLELIQHFAVENMVGAEVLLHGRYKAKRLSGGWFLLAKSDVGDIAITLGGDSGGDSAYHPADHPLRHARARAEFVSVSESKKEEKTSLQKNNDPSLRFDEWWAMWSSVRGTNHRHHAEQVYPREVSQGVEVDCFECTASYLASLDNPNKGYNPENFLVEQGRDKFTARWPERQSQAKDKSFSASVERVMRARVARGEPPL